MAELLDAPELALEPVARPVEQARPQAQSGGVSADTDEPRTLQFEFTGTGAEYFRIWVVNLLLTLLTLGVYSAWAKVRRLQYFYRNTRLDGAVFDFHGSPRAILTGRIVALLLFGAYQIASGISGAATVGVLLFLAAIFPWLLTRAFRFKLANSSYRGVRFRFRGTAGEAYRRLILFPVILTGTGLLVWSLVTSFQARPSIGVMLLAVLLPVAALALLVPLAHYSLKRYQQEQADYGQTPFFFEGGARGFFGIYGKAVGGIVFGMIALGVLTAILGGWFAALAGIFLVYGTYLFLRPYIESRVQNLVWNHTELGMHRFESRVRARKLAWIHASNLLLIVATLGLYKPFALIRLTRYRVSCMALVVSGGLDDFHADRGGDRAGATGNEAGDFFGIDIGL